MSRAAGRPRAWRLAMVTPMGEGFTARSLAARQARRGLLASGRDIRAAGARAGRGTRRGPVVLPATDFLSLYAAATPDKVALVEGDTTLSFDRLNRLSNRYAAVL